MRGTAPFSRFARLVGTLSAVGAWLAAACGGEESKYTAVEDWECFEQKLASDAGAGGAGGASLAAGAGGGEAQAQVASCDCFGVKAGQRIEDPRPRVSSCSGWRCCYAWPKDDGTYDCSCRDEPPGVQLAGFCAEEAAERGGEVVDYCPPTPRDNTSYCAFVGESCAPDYLEELSLSGCCEGLSCETDANGNLACR